MQTSVFGPATSQTFDEVIDSVSEYSGGADVTGAYLCGPRVYKLLNAPSPLYFDQASRTLRLEASSP